MKRSTATDIQIGTATCQQLPEKATSGKRRFAAIAALVILLSASSEIYAQTDFQTSQDRKTLWIVRSAAANSPADITIRPFIAKGRAINDSFEVEIDGITQDYAGVKDISVRAFAGPINVYVEGINLEGSLRIRVEDIWVQNGSFGTEELDDYVAIDQSVIGGDVEVFLNDGDNRMSMGLTTIGGNLTYNAGFGSNRFKEPNSGGTTSQADCTILRDFNYRYRRQQQ